MKRQTQLELAHVLQAHVRNGATDLAPEVFRNPVAAYSDAARAQLERERLFRGLPLFMGMSCRLSDPGDYLAEEVAGIPVMLVRGRDGMLRAFANICRHRGAPVASGCGKARAFSCPYHGWTYALDGKLAGIPEKASFPGIDKEAHGLIPLPAGERYGMIFVCLSPARLPAIDVDAHLAGLGEEFGAYGFEHYSYFASQTMTPAINWKFGIDTFLEAYHLPALHRATVAPLIRGNLGSFAAFGDHCRLTFARHSSAAWDGKPDCEWDVLPHIVVVYRLFPNTIVVFQSDHLETWRMLPGETPERSVIEFALYSPEPATTDKARAYWKKNYDLAIRTVLNEDFALGERMQRGFMSAVQTEVVYGRNEPALIHFHQRLHAALGVS
ncbi:MAG: Rieske 2Fe-2S domain-containing protein [Betaproteobacteria bacterium]|nr:Rieske 2Fe-2S domain-containing protein [Betaproteobacteria bacterium]